VVAVAVGGGLHVVDREGRARPLDAGGVRLAAAAPAGRRLALAGLDRRVAVVDVAAGGRVSPVWSGSFPVAKALAWSADGERLAFGYEVPRTGVDRRGPKGRVAVWSAASGAVVDVRVGASARSLAFSPSGRLLAIGDSDGDLAALDVTRLPEGVERVGGGDLASDSDIDALAFSPDGRWLGVGLEQGSLYVFSGRPASDGDLAPRARTSLEDPGLRLRAHDQRVRALAFLGADRLLSLGGPAGQCGLRLWRLEPPVLEPTGADRAGLAAVAVQGDRVALGFADGRVEVRPLGHVVPAPR